MIKVNQWWGEWLTSTKKSQKQNRKTCRSFGQNHPIRKNKWPSCPACVWYIIIIIIYLHIVWPKRSKFYRIRKKWRWPIGSCIFLVDLNFPKKKSLSDLTTYIFFWLFLPTIRLKHDDHSAHEPRQQKFGHFALVNPIHLFIFGLEPTSRTKQPNKRKKLQGQLQKNFGHLFLDWKNRKSHKFY